MGVGETGWHITERPTNIGNQWESRLRIAAGRMEGLATEAYDLIGKQQKYKAATPVCSYLVWTLNLWNLD